MRVFVYATLAMVAFAANSVICRVALGQASVDAASFTTIRVVSGAIVLLLIAGARARTATPTRNPIAAPMLLTFYAVPFAFAYTRLSTGTGALMA